jgi:predicted RNase H-like HicB family nuclease
VGLGSCRRRRAPGDPFHSRNVRPTRENSGLKPANPMLYHGRMLRYHIAFYLPRAAGEMVVAQALDFPGAVTQGFDLADARLMIASAMEDLAQCLLEEGKPLPTPNPDAAADADLVELVPLTVHVGVLRG